jgi:hypothetical protein
MLRDRGIAGAPVDNRMIAGNSKLEIFRGRPQMFSGSLNIGAIRKMIAGCSRDAMMIAGSARSQAIASKTFAATLMTAPTAGGRLRSLMRRQIAGGIRMTGMRRQIADRIRQLMTRDIAGQIKLLAQITGELNKFRMFAGRVRVHAIKMFAGGTAIKRMRSRSAEVLLFLNSGLTTPWARGHRG